MRTNGRGGIRSIKRSVQVSVGLAVAALGAQQAHADEAAASAATPVDALVVTGRREALQSPKFTEPLRDTPQTVQVIGKELFNQQGAVTLTEALRNSPGVGAFFAGENGSTSTGDAVYMRGFDTSNSIFVDGIRDVAAISRDLFNIEQVEVEKGPAGTDNGRTAPAGAINLVSKEALLENAVSGTVSAGSADQKRATVDVNQAFATLSGGALRLNAMWQDSDVPGRDHVNDKRAGIASSLGLGLMTDTRVFLNLLYVRQDNVPDGFVPTIGLPGWSPQPGLGQLAGHPVDSENFYGTRDDHDDVTAKMATLRLEHDFSGTLRLTNTARWGQTKQDYLLTSFMSTGGSAADPTTGNIKWTNPADLSTYRIARSINTVRDQTNEILTDQLNLRADFATGAVSHTVSLGVELTHETQDQYGVTVTGARPDANLYNPNWNDAGALALTRNGAIAKGKTDTQSIYLFDTLKLLDDKVLIVGGARADHYKTTYFSTAVCDNGAGRRAVPCNGAPLGTVVQTNDLESKDTLFNWKLGAVYKPVSPLSLYINYAISQQPPGGANFSLSTSTTSLDNPFLDPQKAKTLEAGAKWSAMGDKLLVSLALFRTDVSNEINSQVLDDAGNPTQTGKKRVKGIELSAVGRITEEWSISAGYSHLDTRVVEGAPVSNDGSSNLTYTPGDALTVWTTYALPFGLTVGGGVRHTGGLHRGTDGAVGTPAFTKSWTVVDAIVSYPVSENLVLRVNGYNLFDKDYVAAINKSGYRYTPGAPRTFLVSVDYRF